MALHRCISGEGPSLPLRLTPPHERALPSSKSDESINIGRPYTITAPASSVTRSASWALNLATMDPLSIAASVAGLLAIVGPIISKGYSIISGIQKGSNIKALVNEISGFSGVLVGVKSYFSTLDGKAPLIPSLDASTLDATVQSCEQTLREVNELLNEVADAGALSLAIKSGGLNNRVAKLVSRLEGYKSFFTLCLQLQSK